MVDVTPEKVSGAAPAAVDRTGWPSRTVAWWGLGIITLATLYNFFDAAVFRMLVQRIKVDLALSDEELGWLMGPANILFYVLVGIPMARLADLYPRKLVLSASMFLTSTVTSMGGLAQGFAQLFATRTLAGAGGSAHAPASYSLIADYFPPGMLPRAIAFLQLGFIGGNVIGSFVGGQMVAYVHDWSPSTVAGLTIFNWQWVLLALWPPGLLIGFLLLTIKEPPRRGKAREGKAMPLVQVLAEIGKRRAVYLPLFIGLAFSALESFGLQEWRVPLLVRKYGWNEAQIGNWLAPMLLAGSIAGLFVGATVTEWLTKRYKDGLVRATVIMFSCAAPCAVIAPLMPTGELCLVFYSLTGMFGIASAISQNAAIQRITPNEMRGQVTACYLFFFIFFGAIGSVVIGTVNQRIMGSEADLWKTMSLTAAVLMPLAGISIAFAIKPFRKEIERLESLEGQPAPAS
ncbi:MAG: MFS transporter [Hyphomonadaceae bacterium]|nr:MFS transporter [Hyphomonadaceae bacterium]